ncbi:hypothetical protein, partial [Shewanella vesiculosa]|uniref:hypothetical protein n=1 Tax=Shewanella vesiculosa TaxID=518738 RepID=UPI0023592D3E
MNIRHEAYKNRFNLCATIVVWAALLFPSVAFGAKVSVPTEVVTANEFKLVTGVVYQPDASMSSIRTREEIYWYVPMWDKEHGGIAHAKVYGTIDQPIKQVIWIKKK